MFSRLVSGDFSVPVLLKVCSLALGGAFPLICIALNILEGRRSFQPAWCLCFIHTCCRALEQTPRLDFPVGNLSPKRKRAERKGWISQGIHFYF